MRASSKMDGAYFPIPALDRSALIDPARGLGKCAGDVDGTSKHGTIVKGAADRNSGWFRVAHLGDALYVEVHDDHFTAGDRLEMRVGRSAGAMLCGSARTVTQKITIDGTGAVSDKSVIAVKRIRDEAHVRTFEIVFTNPTIVDAWSGFALDMVDDDGGPVRRLSTAAIGPELGTMVQIDNAACIDGPDGPVPVPLVETSVPLSTTRATAPGGIATVVRAWNDATNAHDGAKLSALYANAVDLYGTKVTREKAIAIKNAAFAKHDRDTLGAITVITPKSALKRVRRVDRGRTYGVHSRGKLEFLGGRMRRHRWGFGLVSIAMALVSGGCSTTDAPPADAGSNPDATSGVDADGGGVDADGGGVEAGSCVDAGASGNAKTYYLSNTGNDANAGTDPSAPWQTLTKLNSFSGLAPGDVISFRRGDTFYGSLTIAKSGTAGNPITYGSYGCGTNPVITGLTTVSSWTSLGANIWESASAIPTGSAPNIVVENGAPAAIGRYPNTGWNTTTASTSTSITSSALSPGSWTGAEIVTRDERWIIDRRKITSQSGSTVSFAAIAYNPQNGWGYFIQNSLATLDQQHEWYYDTSSQKLDIYSTSMPTAVQVSTIDVLVDLTPPHQKDYITFTGLTFEGANKNILKAGNANHISIQNCQLNLCGDEAVLGQNWGGGSVDFTIDGNGFDNNVNNAIDLPYEFTSAHVGSNTISNTGMIPGMSGSGDGNAIAVDVQGPGSTVEDNVIDTVGYNGVFFKGSNVTIKNNLINNYCLVKDDGGAIYTFGNSDNNPPDTGRMVEGNIILNGTGTNEGVNTTGDTEAHGIYLDGYSNGISVLNNSVSAASYSGIFLQGNSNVSVVGNTVYDAGKYSILSTFTPTNIVANGNIFVAKTLTEMCLSAGNVSANASNFAFDNNYYARPIDDDKVFFTDFNSAIYDLAQWKTYSGVDAHSSKSPKIVTSTSDLRFEYNATASPTVVSLGANYIDVKGQAYNGSITLAPFTSAVLIKN